MATATAEKGKVVKLDGEYAFVTFPRHEKCDRCRACRVCPDGRHVERKVKNALGACVGDYVEVNLRRIPYTLSALIYLLPLALVAVGVAVGYDMSAKAVAILSAAGAFVGLAIALPIDLCVFRRKLSPVMKCFSADESASDDKN